MPHRPLIIDAHQDLAYNMLAFDRDYRRTVAETRQQEEGSLAVRENGQTLLGWDAYQQGRVAIVFATLFVTPIRYKEGDWDTICYTDTADARRFYKQQLEAYQRLWEEAPDQFSLVSTKSEMQNVLAPWQATPDEEHPVGMVLLMEGAESIGQVDELKEWWDAGLRLIGPAWAGTRFCGGSREPGPLTREGYELLDGMAELGYGLDLSHMDQQAALQALDHYEGHLMATHANAGALLKGADTNRHLPDSVIDGILQREGVIGIVPYNVFLQASWKRGDARELVPLSKVVEQIDYVCQMAGDARHVGIGTDFDGGFGLDAVPEGIDSIADLQKLPPLLQEKGFTDEDITAILGGNWLRMLENILPENQ
ncbi:MAG: peptidase M19 [Chloroflexi bacterium]|nr:peptidase M19 [Chloroflexota bacterium]